VAAEGGGVQPPKIFNLQGLASSHFNPPSLFQPHLSFFMDSQICLNTQRLLQILCEYALSLTMFEQGILEVRTQASAPYKIHVTTRSPRQVKPGLLFSRNVSPNSPMPSCS
jgi:hypothetical protein